MENVNPAVFDGDAGQTEDRHGENEPWEEGGGTGTERIDGGEQWRAIASGLLRRHRGDLVPKFRS
jgi:hypothetical protein